MNSMKQRQTARIHLLAAKEAPFVVIIRRKPSKCFHLIKWHLDSDYFEHGSWFTGKLYPMRCDVSWDGDLMSYLAMGGTGETWDGVCRVPWLKTILESENIGTYQGGGIFWERHKYLANQVFPSPIELKSDWPDYYEIARISKDFNSEDLSNIFHRFHRDGWKLSFEGQLFAVLDSEGHILPGMPSPLDYPHHWQFSSNHPILQARYVGYRSKSVGDASANSPIYAGRSGYLFHFELLEFPDLLGPQVDWATWTNEGDLVWTKHGVVYRQTLDGLVNGAEPRSFDLNGLVRPTRTGPIAPPVV